MEGRFDDAEAGLASSQTWLVETENALTGMRPGR